MIAVIQRTKNSKVTVDNKITGEIDFGLTVLLGVCKDDKLEDADFLTEKISQLRIFQDKQGKMNLSIQDIGGSILVISQFTLCSDCKKGRRPSFNNAATPEKGKQLYEYFIDSLKKNDLEVESGIFGEMMDVSLINCGPVTFVLDSSKIGTNIPKAPAKN